MKIDIKKLNINIKNLEQKIYDEVGNKVVEYATQNAPVDTGNYQSQIRYEGGNEVVANAVYSAAIEYGFDNYEEKVKEHERVITKAFGRDITPVIATIKEHTRTMNRTPKPVMRNAAKETQKEAVQIVNKVLKEYGIN